MLLKIFGSLENGEDDTDDDAGDQEDSEVKEILQLDKELEREIAELGKEELTMVREDADDDEADAYSKPVADNTESGNSDEILGASKDAAILLSDDEDEAEVDPRKQTAVPLHGDGEDRRIHKFNALGTLPKCRIYSMRFDGPSYGIQLRVYHRRLVVSKKLVEGDDKPAVGDVLVALNGHKIAFVNQLGHVLPYLKQAITNSPAELAFAEDEAFAGFYKQVLDVEALQLAEQKKLIANTTPSSDVEAIIDLIDD